MGLITQNLPNIRRVQYNARWNLLSPSRLRRKRLALGCSTAAWPAEISGTVLQAEMQRELVAL